MLWKTVPGTDGRYEVSEFGDLRRSGTERVMRGSVDRKGYRFYRLRREGMSPRPKAHRLVLEAFVGPATEGAFGLHADDNPANNHVSNLRWGTPKENMADRKRNSGWDLGPRHNSLKSHCRHGHEYTPENTLVKHYAGYDHRSCRQCNLASSRRQEQRRRELRAAERS